MLLKTGKGSDSQQISLLRGFKEKAYCKLTLRAVFSPNPIGILVELLFDGGCNDGISIIHASSLVPIDKNVWLTVLDWYVEIVATNLDSASRLLAHGFQDTSRFVHEKMTMVVIGARH
ncbi:hypothetical protein ACHAWO_007110 [Cyclotella atomus]|uniref:Uncharacterized protein n=1 Tax=Cyclotella atomus TaxID=382360 RepID=A0ABD3P4W9_9STRA